MVYHLVGGGKASVTAPLEGVLGLTFATLMWFIAYSFVKSARGFHEAIALVGGLWLTSYFLLWARTVFVLFGLSQGPVLKPWQVVGERIDWVDWGRGGLLTVMTIAPPCAVLYSMPQSYYLL
jgi:hypothetical protein